MRSHMRLDYLHRLENVARHIFVVIIGAISEAIGTVIDRPAIVPLYGFGRNGSLYSIALNSGCRSFSRRAFPERSAIGELWPENNVRVSRSELEVEH